MTRVCREIFKAIHEGKWLSIEYKNKADRVTKYWIGIKSINLQDLSLIVDGLHLGELKTQELKIFINSILSATIIEGSYCKINKKLIEDINIDPAKYTGLFDQIPNLKILNYLVDCHRLDTTPYSCEYKLIHCFDGDRFENGKYQLNEEQFEEIVRAFQYQANSQDGKIRVKQLGLNAISVPVRQGLYVLAYHKLYLDVANRAIRVDKEITFCINGELRVKVVFENVKDLRYFSLYFWDEKYEEYEEFLFDNQNKTLILEEPPGLLRSVRYRRFRTLFNNDYVFYGSVEEHLTTETDE